LSRIFQDIVQKHGRGLKSDDYFKMWPFLVMKDADFFFRRDKNMLPLKMDDLSGVTLSQNGSWNLKKSFINKFFGN
jgi:hypothetical protein